MLNPEHEVYLREHEIRHPGIDGMLLNAEEYYHHSSSEALEAKHRIFVYP